MIIGFIVLAVTFGFWCAIASLLMGYGFLFAFGCYVGGGLLAFCLILLYHDCPNFLKRAPQDRPFNHKQ